MSHFHLVGLMLVAALAIACGVPLGDAKDYYHAPVVKWGKLN